MKLFVQTLLLMTLSTTGFALQKQEIYTLPDSTYALGLTPLEIATKNALIKLRLFNKAKFMELKNNEDDNSELYQSYINEVEELFNGKSIKTYNPKISFYNQYMKNSKIDLAKKVAKHELLKMIQKNWTTLKDTIFNDYGAETWKQARYLTLNKLNEILIYVPRHPNSKSYYLFLFGDSFVQLDKATLKNIRVVLDINSRLDTNTLPPDAATIIPPVESPKSHQAPSKSQEKDDDSQKSYTPPTQNSDYPDQPLPDLEVF